MTKKSVNLISLFIFINSLIIIGFLTFFGYKFSQNEYSQDYYPPSNEMIEICRSSSFCYIDENTDYVGLLGLLLDKSEKNKYNFTLIVDSIPEPEPEPEPEPIPEPESNEYPKFIESDLVPLKREYETLGSYCENADLCLSRRNVSLKQIQSDIQSIGIGKKSIIFYMDENNEN